MCKIGVFVAITTVFAQVNIPISYGVPITLQTLAILLAGIVLGPKNGTLVALIYVLLGIVGIPVFTGFTGGIGILFSRTGGFILAFPFVAFTAGIGSKRDSYLWQLCWLVSGIIVLFTSGLLMFSFITSNSLVVSFSLVVAPFIPAEIIKIVVAMVLSKVIIKALSKGGVAV